MKEDTKQILETFIEKNEKLKGFGLFEQVVDIGLGFSASKQEDGNWEIIFGLPDEEKRDAFINTLRQFTLKKQPISLPALKKLLDAPDLSSGWKAGVKKARKEYCDYLKGYPESIADLWGPRPTREEIFDVVVYGDLVKTDSPLNRKKFKEWTRDEIREMVLYQEFTKIILYIFALVNEVAELSKKEFGM